MQKPQPLGRSLLAEKIDASRIATRSSEAGDQTELDWVFANTEDDRDRRGCSFGRERRCGTGRYDSGHLSADEVSHERRQAIVSAIQPMVLDHHVLPLDVAEFVE